MAVERRGDRHHRIAQGVLERSGSRGRTRRHHAAHRAGRIRLHRRPIGVREIDAAAHPRGADAIPAALSAPALRRHAPAQRDRARLRHRSGHAADGRAVGCARCPEPRHPAGRAGAHLGADPQDRDLHHPFDRGGIAARRSHRGDDRPSRPDQTDHRRAVPTPAQPDDVVGIAGIRSPQARHLAGPGGRSHARAQRRGESFMKIEMSTKARERLLYLISPVGLIIIWQVLLMVGIGDRRFIPAPSDIAQRFVKLAGSGELEWHVAVTLYRVVLGYIIGAVPAVAVGLLMAMFRPVRIFVDPLIAALFPIPKIALMPLLLLAFGFGDASKVALVAIAVFFPVVVNTYVGAANIETIYWDVAKNYGASQTVMFTRIVFFGALPTIFAGLRIALAVSFIVLVASEFVATKSGIGYLIWNSWELLQVDVMFVGIVTIGILGLITSVLFQEIERKAIPWKTE